MPIRKIVNARVPVKIWSREVEDQALAQLKNIAALPFVFRHVAAMPDVHLGKGATVGSVIFVVVVVGGMGSLAGAFLASVLIGVIQTFAVAIDYSLIDLLRVLGVQASVAMQGNSLLTLTVSQVAPILPYLFLVLILIFRPKGLLGTRES